MRYLYSTVQIIARSGDASVYAVRGSYYAGSLFRGPSFLQPGVSASTFLTVCRNPIRGRSGVYFFATAVGDEENTEYGNSFGQTDPSESISIRILFYGADCPVSVLFPSFCGTVLPVTSGRRQKQLIRAFHFQVSAHYYRCGRDAV